ncbi:hypothetical protein H1S01_18495 [Heliobacterium chlorum]|uniref:Holin n=1 Tax=Heliobacterium chlorum TaxID=2698 RepID=A0ABR7T6R8_HELCL|nr:phage holin family protein [Heliobacterium chlorum]MBC9786449.1 hypothetical protein [Heliobacterium chlorum]
MFEPAVVVAVLIAIGQFAKLYIDSKYIPLITLVLGLVAGVAYIPADTVQVGVLNGIIVGLSANGLFDVSKTLHRKIE